MPNPNRSMKTVRKMINSAIFVVRRTWANKDACEHEERTKSNPAYVTLPPSSRRDRVCKTYPYNCRHWQPLATGQRFYDSGMTTGHVKSLAAVWNRSIAQALARHQVERVNLLLEQILPANAFYAAKLAGRSAAAGVARRFRASSRSPSRTSCSVRRGPAGWPPT